MTQYPRTVAAAVAETKSKFELAEAMATEIPSRRPGPGPKKPLTEYFSEVIIDIRSAGGEEKSLEILTRYRETALWVSPINGGNYRWIKGVSFTTHLRCYEAGLSYERFAAGERPERPRKPNPAPTAEQVAEAVKNDPVARAAAGRALDEHYDSQIAERRHTGSFHQPESPQAAQDHAIEVIVRLRAISSAIKAATDAVQTGPRLDDDAIAGATASIDWQINALTILRAVVAGRSDMDAELAEILREG